MKRAVELPYIPAFLHKRGGKFAPSGRDITLPCRSLMVAAGTTPNITYEKEHPGTFQKDPQGKFFQSHRATLPLRFEATEHLHQLECLNPIPRVEVLEVLQADATFIPN